MPQTLAASAVSRHSASTAAATLPRRSAFVPHHPQPPFIFFASPWLSRYNVSHTAQSSSSRRSIILASSHPRFNAHRRRTTSINHGSPSNQPATTQQNPIFSRSRRCPTSIKALLRTCSNPNRRTTVNLRVAGHHSPTIFIMQSSSKIITKAAARTAITAPQSCAIFLAHHAQSSHQPPRPSPTSIIFTTAPPWQPPRRRSPSSTRTCIQKTQRQMHHHHRKGEGVEKISFSRRHRSLPQSETLILGGKGSDTCQHLIGSSSSGQSWSTSLLWSKSGQLRETSLKAITLSYSSHFSFILYSNPFMEN
ncbi:hypothetical protein LR48_Vigan05g085000 [Vigna angularis]|uniref:Uncharacterized protein n=1 Tax=Phaseolus angularis TaxID=3914 RepID=A0A0L9UKM8_PHAAN|nr:hypothetical protein LR48_Vigan05g085000 [Vigna angularis]